jgi:hypothetical protein
LVIYTNNQQIFSYNQKIYISCQAGPVVVGAPPRVYLIYTRHGRLLYHRRGFLGVAGLLLAQRSEGLHWLYF